MNINLNTLLRLTAELTTDENQQTRVAAVETMVLFSEIIKQEEKLPYLIPIVKSLAKDKTEEEHRVQAAVLLGRLAESFGAEYIELYAFSIFQLLATDSGHRVRKAAASQIKNLCLVTREKGELMDKLIEITQALSLDEVWGVRKASCDAFPAICGALQAEDQKEKRNHLVQFYLKMLQDSSRWVKSAAFQYLGPLIASFANADSVHPDLLEAFKTMPHVALTTGDNQISVHCAFNFPAVFLTLGAESWAKLGGLYKTLNSDLQFKVRRSLSFSIHEIAKIMGTEMCEQNLLDIFDGFFNDIEEVKIGVVTHLSEFIAVLSPSKRNQFLQYVKQIQIEPTKWRLRKLLANQLPQLANLYDSKVVLESLLPITLLLASDNFHIVRKKTCSGVRTPFFFGKFILSKLFF